MPTSKQTAEIKALHKERLGLLRACAKIIKGHNPAVQGSVIADLMAMHIAGHDESIRSEIRDGLIKLVDDLVPVNAQIIEVMKRELLGETPN